MGAVNYFTSDYITMGLRPYDSWELEKDSEFMEEMRRECEEYGSTVESAIDNYIQSCYEDDYTNIENELNKHNFHYYHIAIKPGYYEGFTLDIENNYPVALDSWQDRRDANKEITRIKQFLIDCAGLGLVACYPGWCTGYSDYSGTIEAIEQAVKEMRDDVKTVPTWAQYKKGGLKNDRL